MTDGNGNATIYTFNPWGCPSPPSHHPHPPTRTRPTAPGPPATTRWVNPWPTACPAESAAAAPSTATGLDGEYPTVEVDRGLADGRESADAGSAPPPAG